MPTVNLFAATDGLLAHYENPVSKDLNNKYLNSGMRLYLTFPVNGQGQGIQGWVSPVSLAATQGIIVIFFSSVY